MDEDEKRNKRLAAPCKCGHPVGDHSNTKGKEGCKHCGCPLNMAGQGMSTRILRPYGKSGMIYYDPRIETETGELLP